MSVIEYKKVKSSQKIDKKIEGFIEVQVYNDKGLLVKRLTDKNTDVILSTLSVRNLTYASSRPILLLITQPLEQFSFSNDFIKDIKGYFDEFLPNLYDFYLDSNEINNILKFELDTNNKIFQKTYQYLNTSSNVVKIYGIGSLNPYAEFLTIYKFNEPIVIPQNYKVVLKYIIKYSYTDDYQHTDNYNPSKIEITGNTIIKANSELIRKLRQVEYKRTFLQGISNPENRVIILDDTYIPSSSVKITNIYSTDTNTGKAFGEDSQCAGELIIRITQEGGINQAKAKIFLGSLINSSTFYDDFKIRFYPWKEYPPFVKQKQNLIDQGYELIINSVYPFWNVNKFAMYLVKTKSFYLYIRSGSLTKITDIDNENQEYQFTSEQITDRIYKITLNLDQIPEKLGIILHFNSSNTDFYPFLVEDDKDDENSDIYWVIIRLYNNWSRVYYITNKTENVSNYLFKYHTDYLYVFKDEPDVYNQYVELPKTIVLDGWEYKYIYTTYLIDNSLNSINFNINNNLHSYCYGCCYYNCSTNYPIYLFKSNNISSIYQKLREQGIYYFENIKDSQKYIYQYYNPETNQLEFTFDFNSIPEITLTQSLDIINLHIEFDENSTFKVGDTIRIRINDNDKLFILDKLEKFELIKYGLYINEPKYLNDKLEELQTISLIRTDSRRRDDIRFNFGKTPKYIVANKEINLKDDFKNEEEKQNTNSSIYPEYDKIYTKLSYHNYEYYDKYTEYKLGDIIFAKSIEKEEQDKFNIFKTKSKLLKLSYQIDLIRDGGFTGRQNLTNDTSYYEPYGIANLGSWDNQFYANGIQNSEHFILAVPKYYEIETQDENGNTIIERYYTDLRTLKLFLRGGHNKPLYFTIDNTGYWNVSSFDLELRKGYYLIGINKEQIRQVLNNPDLDFENDIYIEGYIRAFKLDDLLPIKVPVSFEFKSKYWKDYITNTKGKKVKYINNKKQPLNDNSELIYIGFDNTIQDVNQNVQVNLYGSESYVNSIIDNGRAWFNDGSGRTIWFDLGDKLQLPLTFTGWFNVRDTNRRLITGWNYNGNPTNGKFDLHIYTINNLFCVNIQDNNGNIVFDNENSSNSIPIELNKWYFYVVRLSQNELNVRVYDINFNLIGERTFDLTDRNVQEPVDSKVAVGSWIGVVNSSGFKYYFNGAIDNYRIFNKLLTDDEIQQVFNKDKENITIDYTEIEDWFVNESRNEKDSFIVKVILPFEVDGKIKVKNALTGKELKFCILNSDYPIVSYLTEIESGNILLVELNNDWEVFWFYLGWNDYIYHFWYQNFVFTTERNDWTYESYPIYSYRHRITGISLRPSTNTRTYDFIGNDIHYVNNLTLGKFNAVITRYNDLGRYITKQTNLGYLGIYDYRYFKYETQNLLLIIERDTQDNRDYSIIRRYYDVNELRENEFSYIDNDGNKQYFLSIPEYRLTLTYNLVANSTVGIDWNKENTYNKLYHFTFTPLYRGVIFNYPESYQQWSYGFSRVVQNNIFSFRLVKSFDYTNTFTHANYVFAGFDYSFVAGKVFYTIYPTEIKELEDNQLEDIEQIIKPVSAIRFKTQPVEYFKPTNPEHLKDISKVNLYYLSFDVNNENDVEFYYPNSNDYRKPYNPLSDWNSAKSFAIYYENLLGNNFVYTQNDDIKYILQNNQNNLKLWDNGHHLGIIENDTNLQNDSLFTDFQVSFGNNIEIETTNNKNYDTNKFILRYTGGLRKFNSQNIEDIKANYNFTSDYYCYCCCCNCPAYWNILRTYYIRYYISDLSFAYGYWNTYTFNERLNNYVLLKNNNSGNYYNGNINVSEINVSKTIVAGETNRDIALFLTKKEFKLQDIVDFGNLNVWSVITKDNNLIKYIKEIPIIYVENKNDSSEYYVFALTKDFQLVNITSVYERIKNKEENKVSYYTVRHLYSGKTYSHFNGKIQEFLGSENLQNYKFRYGLIISRDLVRRMGYSIYWGDYINSIHISEQPNFEDSVYVILGFDIQPRFKDKDTFKNNYKKIDKIAYVNSKTSLFANEFDELVSDVNTSIKIYNPNNYDIDAVVYVDLKRVLNFDETQFTDGIIAYELDDNENLGNQIPLVYEKEKHFFAYGTPTNDFSKWNKRGIYLKVHLRANSITKIKIQNGTNTYTLNDVFPWIETFDKKENVVNNWNINNFNYYINPKFECLELEPNGLTLQYKNSIDFIKNKFVNHKLVISLHSRYTGEYFVIDYLDENEYKHGYVIRTWRYGHYINGYLGIRWNRTDKNELHFPINILGAGGIVYKFQYDSSNNNLILKAKSDLILDKKTEDFLINHITDNNVLNNLTNTANNPRISLYFEKDGGNGIVRINFIYIDWNNAIYEPVVLYYEDLYLAFDGLTHKSSTYFYIYDNEGNDTTEVDKDYFTNLVWNEVDEFGKGLYKWNISNLCPNENDNALTIRTRQLYGFADVFNNYLLNLLYPYSPFRFIM